VGAYPLGVLDSAENLRHLVMAVADEKLESNYAFLAPNSHNEFRAKRLCSCAVKIQAL